MLIFGIMFYVWIKPDRRGTIDYTDNNASDFH